MNATLGGPMNGQPSRRHLLTGIREAERLLKMIGSDWKAVPGHVRAPALRLADRLRWLGRPFPSEPMPVVHVAAKTVAQAVRVAPKPVARRVPRWVQGSIDGKDKAAAKALHDYILASLARKPGHQRRGGV